MKTTSQIAKHLRDVHFGGNWATSNLKDQVANVSWQQATEKVHDFNTIATLFYHITYYVAEVTKVLQGNQLEASDKLSFDHPPINSQEDWENMQEKAWANAEIFAKLIEQLPDSILKEDFTDPKYGSYFRNLHGIIEHFHYHLGQIVLIKKMVQEKLNE